MPITYSDWGEVPKAMKEHIWEEVKVNKFDFVISLLLYVLYVL